jgi:predicted ArsR family transcriptional regulator
MPSTTRQEILALMKRRGPMTVQELSHSLQITPMGVRQHLAILERDGQVRSGGVRRGQGRPSRVYGITAEGDKVFPRTYEQTAVDLLGDLAALDGQAKVNALFEHRRRHQLAQYRGALAGKDLPERVAALARLRDDEGYCAESQAIDRDTFVLIEHNCPIRAVAEAFPAACACEAALFTDALEAGAVRTDHIAAGAPRCRYVITRRAESVPKM